ncbi:MAG: diphosphomevalonate decarboxylase [Ichthyobacteriaceae bacterium]|nr:diphosphomevalonate decarboxylase [Ichthyobacteriaceae bacterium]
MNTDFFIPKNLKTEGVDSHVEKWTSPSNIALVKYWGKFGNQMPANPSLSFTLKNSYSETEVRFEKKYSNTDEIDFELFFEGVKSQSFSKKVSTYLNNIVDYVPYILNYKLVINTTNSFPHSSGIASSASGFSALSACLISFEKTINADLTEKLFNKKMSFISRLGSGSASRSLQGPVMVWGTSKVFEGSTDYYAIVPNMKLDKIYTDFQDTILLIDEGKKEVSSTVGHGLMNGHPFAEQRFVQANNNIAELKEVLENGNITLFGEIVENEALSLHAMMMTSTPSYILIKPNTLAVIEKVKEFRKATGVHLYFTLDAGANIHLLYPKSVKKEVLTFIDAELSVFCENERYICDEIGNGAKNV